MRIIFKLFITVPWNYYYGRFYVVFQLNWAAIANHLSYRNSTKESKQVIILKVKKKCIHQGSKKNWTVVFGQLKWNFSTFYISFISSQTYDDKGINIPTQTLLMMRSLNIKIYFVFLQWTSQWSQNILI